MNKILYLLLFVSHIAVAHPTKETSKGVIHQLRIYEIFEHNKAAFHERFDKHAQRIMKNYGFQIVSMWETKNEEKTAFVYLLEWPDIETLQDSWKKFMDDEEWKEIKRQTAKEHGQLVGDIQDQILSPLYYSPKKAFYSKE